MLIGGAFVGVIGVARGELATFDPSGISMRSFLAWLYLLVFGSLIAFTAFVYLLRVSTPARVATYAYVNPVVAVILGWLLGGESISGRMLVAAGIIVAGVATITAAEGRAPQEPQAPELPTERETAYGDVDEMRLEEAPDRLSFRAEPARSAGGGEESPSSR
jgi:threonine/homoserine efflux transporter RhtA